MRLTNNQIGLAIVAALALVGFVALSCSNADAREFYVKAEIGTTIDTQASGLELNDDLTYGAYVGTDVGPLRVEAGVAHLAASTSIFGTEIATSAIDYSATAYLDHSSGLYVGAGVDYIQAEATVGGWWSDDYSGTGWHVAGGYATRVSDNAVVEFQVRYTEADLDVADLTTTAATVGVRFAL